MRDVIERFAHAADQALLEVLQTAPPAPGCHRAAQFVGFARQRLADRELAKMTRNGRLGSMVAGAVNWASKEGNGLTRPVMEAVVGIDRYGESAPAGTLFEHFHFTAANVATVVRRVLGR